MKDGDLRCAHCNGIIDKDWRRKRIGIHTVCIGCVDDYKTARITHLEAQLKNISLNTSGKAKDLASIALYSNTRNAPT